MSAKMTETLEKHVPIAQKFHKSKPVAEEDLIAPKKVLLPFNTFLLCSQWLVFIIMLVYYSDPVNYVKQSELQIKWNWGKDGDGADSTAYNCTPVQTDEYWGHEFNYDTCKLYALFSIERNHERKDDRDAREACTYRAKVPQV